MFVTTALLLLLSVPALASAEGNSGQAWALLVTGSKTFDNYRHHADTAHAYHRLVAGGIPPSHIVSLQYNDVPNDPENPYPGTLFNRATGKKPGVNVNAGFHRSYEKDQVTAGNFLAALRCGNNTGPCVGPKGSLAPNSTLFIFWAGHGGNGMLFLPDMQAQTALYADDLVSALREARKRGFGRVVMYVEACDSGSMFQGLLGPSDAGIFAVTAAAKSENSYPTYCCDYFRPPSCTVHGHDIGSCLGDLFSVAVWENADTGTAGETLASSVANAKRKTKPKDGNPGSTVEQFGDTSVAQDPLARYIGAVNAASNLTATTTTHTPPHPQPNAAPRPHHRPSGQQPDRLSRVVLAIARHLTLPATQDEKFPGEIPWACYKRMNRLLENKCRYHSDGVWPLSEGYALMLRACQADKESQARKAIMIECPM